MFPPKIGYHIFFFLFLWIVMHLKCGRVLAEGCRAPVIIEIILYSWLVSNCICGGKLDSEINLISQQSNRKQSQITAAKKSETVQTSVFSELLYSFLWPVEPDTAIIQIHRGHFRVSTDFPFVWARIRTIKSHYIVSEHNLNLFTMWRQSRDFFIDRSS